VHDKKEQHNYQLYLALNDIEHAKTKAGSPQTNGTWKDSMNYFARDASD